MILEAKQLNLKAENTDRIRQNQMSNKSQQVQIPKQDFQCRVEFEMLECGLAYIDNYT